MIKGILSIMVWYILSITITITKVREINKEKNRLFMIV